MFHLRLYGIPDESSFKILFLSFYTGTWSESSISNYTSKAVHEMTTDSWIKDPLGPHLPTPTAPYGALRRLCPINSANTHLLLGEIFSGRQTPRTWDRSCPGIGHIHRHWRQRQWKRSRPFGMTQVSARSIVLQLAHQVKEAIPDVMNGRWKIWKSSNIYLETQKYFCVYACLCILCAYVYYIYIHIIYLSRYIYIIYMYTYYIYYMHTYHILEYVYIYNTHNKFLSGSFSAALRLLKLCFGRRVPSTATMSWLSIRVRSSWSSDPYGFTREPRLVEFPGESPSSVQNKPLPQVKLAMKRGYTWVYTIFQTPYEWIPERVRNLLWFHCCPMFEPWPEASPSAAGDLCLPDHARGLRKDRGPTASCSDGLETLLSGKMWRFTSHSMGVSASKTRISSTNHRYWCIYGYVQKCWICTTEWPQYCRENFIFKLQKKHPVRG